MAIVVSHDMTRGFNDRACMLHCVRLVALLLRPIGRGLSIRGGFHVLRRNGKNLRFQRFYAVSVQVA